MMVEIDNDTALDMLVDRVKSWTSDSDTIDLFAKMYEHYIYGGCFDGGTFDINEIVDNDYVNYCDAVYLEELPEEIRKVVQDAINNGDYDISCENVGYSYIEAISDDEKMVLLRY